MNELFELFYNTSGVCTDTRKIEKDCLFVCLKGANFNGNEFAKNALSNGAKYAVIDDEAYYIDERTVLVRNALEYLQKLANFHRHKFRIPVIGITGSNGKTSTKELINAVLSKKYHVLATVGNLNNHIGVPLTLLKINEKHEMAIIEMGANKLKDIEELCVIADPTFGIITNIGKAHLEGMGGFEGILKTKRELYDAISKIGGTIVFNGDDDILTANLPKNVSTLSYGSTSDNNIIGSLINLTPFISFYWKNKTYQSPEINTKMVGKYNFYNYMAAISFGKLFDVPSNQINEAIAAYEPVNNRSQVVKKEKNVLIMDCYNANPTSMQSAIDSFVLNDHPQKIVIVGDMLELGDDSSKEHLQIIRLMESLNLQGFTVGPIFGEIQSDFIIGQFRDVKDAQKYFKDQQIEDALILLKGSRGIGLEALAEIF